MLSPFRRFWDMQSEMNRMMAEAFGSLPQAQTSGAGWTPAVDVVTKDNDMLIRAELPGMQREDVEVSFQNGVLTISGERKVEEEHKDCRLPHKGAPLRIVQEEHDPSRGYRRG